MRDIIPINTTNYVGNNLYRVRLPKAHRDECSSLSYALP